MNQNMGQVIKRLRKERDLTQEDLAEQINVSPQAISKWENGASMPDISQVLPLANLFRVSTDVLFGIYEKNYDDEVNARLEEIYCIYDNCKDGEEGPTALVLLDKYRDAIRMFPNNSNILSEAIAFGEIVISNNRKELSELIGEKGIEDLTQEIINWAELVIKYSSSASYIMSAKRNLFNIYISQERWNDAEKTAKDFPYGFYDNRGILIAELKRKTNQKQEEREWRCDNIQLLAAAFGHQITMMGNSYKDEERYEEALYCYSFFKEMVEALYRNEKYRPPFVYDYYPLYYFPAYCLMKLGKFDEAVTSLEEGVEFIKAQAESYNKKRIIDNPLLCEHSFGYGHDGQAEFGDLYGRLHRFVCSSDFKPLQDHTKYKTLVQSIRVAE